jgi:predicted Zn-dependent peptidase
MPAQLHHINIYGTEIPVIFERDTYLPLGTMQLVFENGGALNDALPGVAKMTARILGEGTRRDGSSVFAERLESRAVSLSAHAGRETFVVGLGSLMESFDYGAGLVAELLGDPNLTLDAFAKVQTQTEGKLTQKQSDFDYLASVGLSKILFEGTPLADPMDGTLETVRKMEVEDLLVHLNTFVSLFNLVVVIGGDMTLEKAEGFVRRAIAPLKQTSAQPIGHFHATDASKTVRQHHATDQAYVYFGSPFDVAHGGEETALAKVAGFVLGSSGFGSRLMEEIRVERGLAYSAYGRFALNRSASYFTGHLQTKLESEVKAIEVVRDVVSRFVREGITAKELDGAKQFLLGSEPLRNETLQQRLGRAFNDFYAGKPLDASQRELEAIEAMSLDEINRFIADHGEIEKLSFSVVTAHEL